MGKNLKGKECGKGICQRKDGLYYARFVDKTGKRHEKYLPTLPEARNWIEESKYADAHEDVFVATDTTVDQWFDFWIENIAGDLALIAPQLSGAVCPQYSACYGQNDDCQRQADVTAKRCSFRWMLTMRVPPSVKPISQWVRCSRLRR